MIIIGVDFHPDEADSAVFYDLPQYRPFWTTVQELGVPFYLHPRSPLSTRQQAYEGYPWLAASPWGFAVETSIHALRLHGQRAVRRVSKTQGDPWPSGRRTAVRNLGSARESGGHRDFGGFGVLEGQESSSRRCWGNVGTHVRCGFPSAEGEPRISG